MKIHSIIKYITNWYSVAFFKGTLKVDHRDPEVGAKQGSETGVRNRGPKQGLQNF